MPTPETRYAKSGDVNIAYQALGVGPTDLVFVPGVISNLEAAWLQPALSEWLERLASFSRLIWFDKRGTGISDRVGDVAPLETRVDDVRAVMEDVGSERAVLMGVSEGGPMSIVFAATYPERVSGLILWGSSRQGRQQRGLSLGAELRRRDPRGRARSGKWGTPSYANALLRNAVPTVADDVDFQAWWGRYLRLGASPGSAAALLRMNMEIDVRAVLPAIRVPTLVLHRADDQLVDVRNSRYIAKHIPDARLLELPGVDHFAWVGDVERVLDEIRGFLSELEAGIHVDRRARHRPFHRHRGFDRAGRRARRPRWREVVGNHHRRVRAELARFRGEELDTAGDGFFAAFDGPARAVRCACAIRAALADLGLDIRAGLHTGECEVLEEKVAGIAVSIGARVAGEARPGEVLVSQTVKDLVAGSGIEFAERGLSELKGVPGDWRLFAVESV